MNIERNTPTKPGLYLARTYGYKWWNVIALVYGEAPYLKVDVWNLVVGGLRTDVSHTDYYFGPCIWESQDLTPEEREKFGNDWK